MTQKQKPQSKADFVRSMPKTMTPAEIIEEGKKANITISTANVHATRYADNINGHKAKRKKAKKKLSKLKAPETKKGEHFKAPEATLSKYPNMRKASNGVIAGPDEAEIATRVVTGLRLLVRMSVRDEIKSLMGGIFQA